MNKTSPLVSVIIRCKDRPHLLTKAVSSVVEQSYRPLELVVINDGGEDVLPLLEGLLKDAIDISLNHTQNTISHGRTRAANTGLFAATGEFSIFLDDDDYFDMHHIKTLVEHHTKHFPDAYMLGAVHCQSRAVHLDNKGEESVLSIQGSYLSDDRLFYQNCLPILTVLFPTKVRELNVRFDEQFDLFEDWDFWLQVRNVCDFEFLEQISCSYLIHEDNSGVRNYDKQLRAYQAIYRKWLPSIPSERLSKLLSYSHLHHDQSIAHLQAANQKELNRIGALHSHALSVVSKKDAIISDLVSRLHTANKEMRALKLTSPYYIGKYSLQLIAQKCRRLFTRKH